MMRLLLIGLAGAAVGAAVLLPLAGVGLMMWWLAGIGQEGAVVLVGIVGAMWVTWVIDLVREHRDRGRHPSERAVAVRVGGVR